MIKKILYKNRCFFITTSFLNEEIKDFVRNVFKVKYNANIDYFEESFLILKDESNNILSVLGLRDYKNKNFLVEKYLKKDMKEILGYDFKSTQILEIGNLSSMEKEGFGSILIFNSIDYILNTNADYAFITATHNVENILKKYKIIFEIISPANKNDLENANQWGTYYEQKPNLIKIDLITTKKILREKIYE